MLSAIMWGVMSALSFVLFFILPDGPTGPNFLVLVPGVIALAAAVHRLTQIRSQPARRFAALAPSTFDGALVARTERLRHDKFDEQNQMLKHQSSRRRAASALSKQHNDWK